MSKRRHLRLFLMVALFLLMIPAAWAQLGGPREMRKIAAKPDEMISLSASLPFDEAVAVFSELSKRHLGKIIIDPEGRTEQIGVNVETMHWLDAFERVLLAHELWYQENSDHILITSRSRAEENEELKNSRELYSTREVVIYAVFFEANLNKVRSLGMSWNFWNDDSTQSVAQTSAESKTGILEASYLSEESFGNMLVRFKALENNQAGEILASPRIVVRSGKEGRIQIGSDFTITTQDFAGNTVTQFFSTGSIIEVKPDILTLDTLTFVHLDLDVQKSSANSSDLGIEVKKNTAQTSILLLNGEETVIGGLYTNEESISREGVPFLKDLPWWFFGLRYIFGYESKSVVRKELVIVLRAELVPSLKDRVEDRWRAEGQDELLRDALKRMEDDREKYRHQSNRIEKKPDK